MICKKCGRKYEDDMPKCLGCDAPNESLSSQNECETTPTSSETQREAFRKSLKKLVDSKLEQAFANNVLRGKSAISWTKFQMVLNVFFFFMKVKTFGVIAAAYKVHEVGTPVSEDVKSAMGLLMIYFLFTAIPFYVYIGKNGLWVYHAHKEQSKFTETRFTPWGATICYFIPVVNYFVFKALLENQYNTLKTLGIKAKASSNELLKWFLIFNIVTPIFNFITYKNFNISALFISTLLWFILTIFYIKLIRVATANEQAMHDQLENNRINQKVEEIIAQREAESASRT